MTVVVILLFHKKNIRTTKICKLYFSLIVIVYNNFTIKVFRHDHCNSLLFVRLFVCQDTLLLGCFLEREKMACFLESL